MGTQGDPNRYYCEKTETVQTPAYFQAKEIRTYIQSDGELQDPNSKPEIYAEIKCDEIFVIGTEPHHFTNVSLNPREGCFDLQFTSQSGFNASTVTMAYNPETETLHSFDYDHHVILNHTDVISVIKRQVDEILGAGEFEVKDGASNKVPQPNF